MENFRSSGAGALAHEFAFFREELPMLMRRMDWDQMVTSLGRLNELTQESTYREICLKSQAVMDLLGRRGSGLDLPGERVLSLMDGLLSVLAYSEWREKEKIASIPASEVAALSGWEISPMHDNVIQ